MIYTWLVTHFYGSGKSIISCVDFPASSWNADFLETQFSAYQPKTKGPVEIQFIYPSQMVDLSIVKRLPEGKPPFSYGFPMVFPFYYGFPMVLAIWPWRSLRIHRGPSPIISWSFGAALGCPGLWLAQWIPSVANGHVDHWGDRDSLFLDVFQFLVLKHELHQYCMYSYRFIGVYNIL